MSFVSISAAQHQWLQRLGLKAHPLQHWLGLDSPVLPSRVLTVHRGACEVLVCPFQNHLAAAPEAAALDGISEVPSGQTGFVVSAELLPGLDVAVGDWVLLSAGEPARVEQILPRVTWLRRAGVQASSHAQLIAANLDTVFVVCACASSEKLEQRLLNPRRLERFLWLVREGGAQAVVLVNKQDLSAHAQDLAPTLARDLGGTQVMVLSAHTGTGLQALAPYLAQGQTVGFLGASGVGKSTLINRLLGRQQQHTGDVRDDGKGRHTTTRRELQVMSNGALLIDTPGMREVSLYSEDGQAQGFADVHSFAQHCRFTDCGHENEPGCAVTAAIARGDLSAVRLESYRSLSRDAARQATRHDAYARHLAHQQVRSFARRVRDGQKLKRGG